MKRLRAPRALAGELSPPGDKSIAHRALLFNALAQGSARVENFPAGADPVSTLSCLRRLGVEIQELSQGVVEVHGVGGANLREAADVLDCGNSGTTLRLLAGVLAAHPFLSVLTGDSSLRSRPMGRLVQPLRQMGAQVWARQGDTLAPLVIRGGDIRGIEYRLPIASAQVKSALLLAGLFASGETALAEPAPSRDHSERMLKAMGARLEQAGDWWRLSPLTSPLRPLSLSLPGDISSAAFFLVAAVLHPQARVVLRRVGANPTRTGILDVLEMMGASLKVESRGERGGEPVADITGASASLRGVELGGEIIPRLLDEVPVLAVAATQARGTTAIRDAAELRVKESDRLAATARELNRLGARVSELPDGLLIEGPTPLRGTEVDSHGDHRLAMALAVAALVAAGETVIAGVEAAEVSYPRFWQDLEALGQN